jgi:hypothetical protein
MLRPIDFNPNWQLKGLGTPHFLLMGIGHSIDDVVERLAVHISAAQIPGMTVGSVKGMAEVSRNARTLRVMQVDRGVHYAVADILARRQGDDLYISIQPQARTMLKHLRILVFGTLFLLGWMALYGVFFSLTDVRESYIRDYVANWHSGDQTTQRVLREQYLGIPLPELVKRDPKLALTNLGGPPAIFGAIVGGALALVGKSLTTLPARLLGWPTPQEFEALVTGHVAWIEGTLSAVLLHEFGIHEGQRVSLQK